MSQDTQVFEETFTITSINAEKYDRVSRLFGTSTSDASITMSLDINHELFNISVGENVNMVLATSLSLDPSKKDKGETAVGGWREQSKGETTLADMFEYVCHGKNYRFEDADGEACKYFASFGGLLLYIEAPYQKLQQLKIDYIYMLLKK